MSQEQNEVIAEDAGLRIDLWLVRRAGMSRARAKKWCAEGWVRRNGRRCRKGDRVALGDAITFDREPTPSDFSARPDTSLDLEILFEDEHFVVINKPAGMASHPLEADEVGTAANGLVARYPEMASIGYRPREPGIVHRLDTDTSGCLLAARTAEAFEGLRDLLQGGRIDKRYQAIVDGVPTANSIIDHPIAHDRRDRRRMIACEDSFDADELDARNARSEVLSVDAHGDRSLVEVRAANARRHQVRVHLAAIGHPLLGDLLYDGPSIGERHALHANRLDFTHPITGKALSIVAPLPAEMRSLLS